MKSLTKSSIIALLLTNQETNTVKVTSQMKIGEMFTELKSNLFSSSFTQKDDEGLDLVVAGPKKPSGDAEAVQKEEETVKEVEAEAKEGETSKVETEEVSSDDITGASIPEGQPETETAGDAATEEEPSVLPPFPDEHSFEFLDFLGPEDLFTINHIAISAQMQVIFDDIHTKVGEVQAANLKETLDNFKNVENLHEVLPNDVENNQRMVTKITNVFLNEAATFLSEESPELSAQIRVPIAIMSSIIRSEEMR